MLGVEVDDRLVRSWCEWLAPAVQPFFVDSARSWPEAAAGEDLSPELRDTYRAWRLESPYEVVWLDEPTFMGIARGRRRELVRCQVRRRRGAVPSVRGWSDLIAADSLRAQADGHRFVWWPSLLRSAANDVLSRVLAEDTASSRHGEVPERTWRACERVLPFARAYAGTFPAGSGPNWRAVAEAMNAWRAPCWCGATAADYPCMRQSHSARGGR